MKEIIESIDFARSQKRKPIEVRITNEYMDSVLSVNPVNGQDKSKIDKVMGIPLVIDDTVNKFEIVLESR